ncbi:hypothetical protein CK216_24215 [Mesorhizobium sp. WSM3876]|nr:hypothetical protein CK216_24215 [Mesorhizobium sp. WSM3876]
MTVLLGLYLYIFLLDKVKWRVWLRLLNMYGKLTFCGERGRDDRAIECSANSRQRNFTWTSKDSLSIFAPIRLEGRFS